jgi:TPR repeat protein
MDRCVVQWNTLASKQGYASSDNAIGIAFELGHGVPKDLSIAVTWYRQGAERGNAISQANLSLCYRYGTYTFSVVHP